MRNCKNSSLHNFTILLLTGYFLLLTGICRLKAQSYPNCSEIHYANPAAPDGVYLIDPDGDGPLPAMNCQCDMTTDGGGWTLVLNYNHLESTGPALTILTNSLPLIGQTTLGFDESNTVYWGHAGTSLLSSIPFDEVRFYGITSGHNRVIDFKTSHSGTISYFKSGSGSTEGIKTDYTPLALHTSFLPASIDMSVYNRGDLAMTDYPLWTGAAYHWYLAGPDANCTPRWEVDDYPCSNTPSTYHQLWVRQNNYLGVNDKYKSGVEIRLSPNPVNDIAELLITNLSNMVFNQTHVKVTDIIGQQVYPKVTRNSDSFTIHRGFLTAGIYICQLVNETGVISVTKMVIE